MVALKKFAGTKQTLLVCLILTLCHTAAAAEVVLLDFGSATCGPCREMRPVVQRIAAAGYDVRHIDIARDTALAAQFKVDQVPTFIAIVDGREYARMIGTGSFEQLQEILTPRGENVRGQSPDPMSSQAMAPQAQPSQALPTQAMNATAAAPMANPFGNPPPAASTTPSGPAKSHDKLLEATVKISVEDADGTSAGTGTIVDARDGAALLLTCGHLFRTSAGKGPIEVTFYKATPAGAQVKETAQGQLLNYDLERDLALVIVRPQSPVQALSIAPPNTPISPGANITTVGCNGGDNPTAIDSQITTIDRYQGPPNVEVAGAPVEGRSGGGLFNTAGQLIGVCFAADPQSNEGLYASLPSIQAKLDSLNLGMVYQSPAGQNAVSQVTSLQEAPVAPTEDIAIRGQDELVDRLPDEFASVTNDSPKSLSTSEQAALEEIQRRGLKSEVICIIRAHDPEGKSEVITLNNVSPEFVNSLAHPPAPVRSPVTAAAGRLLR